MCIQVIERYAACRCIYYKHAVDPCPAYGRRGHDTRIKEVSVGIRLEEQSRQEATTTRTPATVAVPAAGTTLRGFVGDDRTAERAAWTGYRIGNSGVSGRAGGEERRWQYAMRITASVFGAPVALP